jgi:hypothetical protein
MCDNSTDIGVRGQTSADHWSMRQAMSSWFQFGGLKASTSDAIFRTTIDPSEWLATVNGCTAGRDVIKSSQV